MPSGLRHVIQEDSPFVVANLKYYNCMIRISFFNFDCFRGTIVQSTLLVLHFLLENHLLAMGMGRLGP